MCDILENETNCSPFWSTRDYHRIFNGVHVARYLVLCVVLCRSLFVLLLLTIVLSVLLRFADFDYPFGIFKLFFNLISIRLGENKPLSDFP